MENQTTDATKQASTAWGMELQSILQLAKENASVVLTSVLFLTGCSIFFYATEERVAINILSSDMVAAIPLLFCLIVFFTLLMLSFVIAPTWLALNGASADKDGRLRPLFNTNVNRKGKNPKIRKIALKTLAQWLFLFSTPGLLLTAWAFAEVKLKKNYDTGPWLLLVTITASVFFATWMAGRIRRPHRNRTTPSDFPTRALASFAQMMVMITIISATSSYCSQWSLSDGATVAALATACVLAALFQISIIAVISIISARRGFLRRAVLFILCTVVIFCIYPPLSSFILRPFFGASAAPSSQCFRFAIKDGSNLPTAIKDSKFSTKNGQEWSQRLRALAPIGDFIQVRLKADNGVTYRIESSHLEQTLACSEENRQSENQ